MKEASLCLRGVYERSRDERLENKRIYEGRAWDKSLVTDSHGKGENRHILRSNGERPIERINLS